MSSRIPKPLAIVLILLCALPAGCRKKAESAKAPAQSAAPDTSAHAAAPAAPGGSAPESPSAAPDWINHPQLTPGTVTLSAVDPHDMTPSERAFGRAPKLSPDVDYQPGVIVMEQGDKAIKSIASDGITWTFHANAPQVSDFQVGKIVFATGRAVGKILGMTRNGDDVAVYLGPILLTDVIKRGRFVMEQPIDPDKIISYVAPDYPGANDTTEGPKSAMLGGARRGGMETVVISTVSHGKWTPTSMSRTDGEGRRATYRRRDRRWELASMRTPQGLPSMPQGLPHVPSLEPLSTLPNKSVNMNNGDLRVDAVANKTYLGIQYYYNGSGKVHAYAGGLLTLHAPTVRCVLKISSAGVDSAGISIIGAAGVILEVNSQSPKEVVVNLHLHKVVPLDMSIQLGGPIPFSLTFALLFDVNSGFSAKTSMLTARGEYSFSGGIWAGRADGRWTLATPTDIKAPVDLGKSIDGISLGITSFAMSFAIRTTVGIGAFGFSTGVFAQVRFGGSLLRAPNEAFQCRQATINTYLDTGLGYALPQWAASVINLFLTAVSAQPIDPVGTLAKGPTAGMFKGFDQIPTGCSGPSTG
jgi:hypothetical protein